jgi:hypothetical protein
MLQPNATPQSHYRLALAQELTDRCPRALGQEVALTGSVALGLADDGSDVELNLWVEALPDATQRDAWLAAIGATDVKAEDMPWGDGTFAATFRYRGVTVEAGWQTITMLEAALRSVLDEHRTSRLTLVYTVSQAVTLRSEGALATWQSWLADYPDGLREWVIEQNTNVWRLPHAGGIRWALVRRRDVLALNERLTWDVYNILNLLFALNRRWRPDWKWLRHKCAALPVQPERLAERIEAIFTAPELDRRVATCQHLILDTLALLPPSPSVVLAQQRISEHLDTNERHG